MKKTLTALIIIASLLLPLCSCRFPVSRTEEPETTTVREYVTDINGASVPVFEDVEKSAVDTAKFIRGDNGRIKYDDVSFDTLTGIDVSVFQGDINWTAVAEDGIDYVMLRIGGRGYGPDGALYEDSRFEENYAGAKAAGLKTGVYFFSQAITMEEAVQEARFVTELLTDKSLDMPVAFDWEHVDDTSARTAKMTGAEITSFAKAFCDTVTTAGHDAVIYFNREHGYFNYELSMISDYKFWYAEYADYPSFLYDYTMWQYTEKGTVAGIEGNVDINIALYDNAVG